MTSPLQAAHEQAAADGEAEAIVCTVAAPRQVAMTGTYSGAELQSRSVRPGAYDAMRLPSLVNGRKQLPGAPVAAPVHYTPPTPSPRALAAVSDSSQAAARPSPIAKMEAARKPQLNRYGTYQPKTGSVPDRVIKALAAMPPNACLSMADIETQFGLPVRQFYGTFRTPIEKGALLFFRRDNARRERVIALPGYVVIQEPATTLVPNEEPQPGPSDHNSDRTPYRPREGSGPHQVLKHLQQHGGHLLYSEICSRFAIPSHSLTAIFKPALLRGALIRLHVGNRRALALPGYVPPEAPSTSVPNLRASDPLAIPAAEVGRALEAAARLLLQAATAIQRFTPINAA